jgi:signal transduction histidine kinase
MRTIDRPASSRKRSARASASRRSAASSPTTDARDALDPPVACTVIDAPADGQAAGAAAGARPSGIEFLARMGHELRTPLSTIIGFAQILRDHGKVPLSPEQAAMVGQIEAAGVQLLGMVGDAVELARIEAGRLVLHDEALDLCALALETIAAARVQAQACGLRLEADVPGRCLMVGADRARLRQALGTVIGHAIKYNHRGGWIRVTVEESAAGEGLVCVTDSGQGLSEAVLAALFDPFRRTALDGSSAEGVGIGMMVARRLVERMGGWLEPRRDAGQPARLVIAVPPPAVRRSAG